MFPCNTKHPPIGNTSKVTPRYDALQHMPQAERIKHMAHKALQHTEYNTQRGHRADPAHEAHTTSHAARAVPEPSGKDGAA